MFTLVSYGGGQDSTAIFLRCLYESDFRRKYIQGDMLVVISDTGDEHPHTTELIKRMSYLAKTYRYKCHFLWVKPKDGHHTPAWPDLMTPQLRPEGGRFKPTMVQLGTKSCTDKLKLVPIYKAVDEWVNKKYGYGFEPGTSRKRALKRYAEEYGPLDVLIGYAAGEESRAEKSMKQQEIDRKSGSWKSHLRRVFPLIQEGWTRKDCQAYCEESLNIKVYPSNCMRCPYMSEAELLWLYKKYPKKYREWVDVEAAKLVRHAGHPKNNGVFGSKVTIPERLVRAKLKYGHLTISELDEYKYSHGCATNNM